MKGRDRLAGLWKVLGPFLRPRQGYFLLALGGLFTASLLNYLGPLVAAALIDHALAGRPPADGLTATVHAVLSLGGPLEERAWLAALVLVALAAAAGGCSYLQGRMASAAADSAARDLKDTLFDRILRLPVRFHDRNETGDLVQRCTSDVETLRQFVAVQVVEVCQAVLLVVLALPLMIGIDARMTVIVLGLILPLVVFATWFFRRVRQVFGEVDEAEAALTSCIQETVTGIRVVRAFARQEHEEARFGSRNERYRKADVRLLRLLAWYWAPSDFVCLAQSGLVLFLGGQWVMDGSLTVGQLFAFIAYLNLLQWPVRNLGRTLTDMGKATVAAGRIDHVLSEPLEEPAARAGNPVRVRPTGPAAGAIEVEGLRFGFGGAAHALDGLSFRVEPGQTVALLGPSGAGKSTFVSLLLRLYDYTEGSIRLDGVELRDLDRDWLRSQIGTVLQEPFLFSRSLRENIRLGRATAGEEEVHAAARAAAIHDTIRRFPQQYETLLGERGITLSGGQRQRVALARALVRDPALLVLDDALSAVDGETEAEVLAALQSRRGRRTTLIIAHRLTTVQQADRLIVIERGRVVEEGRHEDLIQRGGLYQRLWTIQTSIEAELAGTLGQEGVR